MPVAVVGTVIVLAVAGFIVAIDRLSSTRSGGPSTGGTGPARASGSSTLRAASAGGLVKISEWPANVAGWTVVLARSRSAPVAYAKATKLANQGIASGVLDSSQHPGFVPGYWVVFSGRYVTEGEAKAAADSVASKGHPTARAKLVERPGSS